MEVLYLLIPISLILLGLIFWLFSWAVRNGQFDDLDAPAQRILMDCDRIVKSSEQAPAKNVSAISVLRKTQKED